MKEYSEGLETETSEAVSQPTAEPSVTVPDIEEVPEESVDVPVETSAADYTESLKKVETIEGAEKFLTSEGDKTKEVVDLATFTLEAAEQATQTENIFKEEKQELQTIQANLVKLSATPIENMDDFNLDVIEATLENYETSTAESISSLDDALDRKNKAKPLDESNLGHSVTLTGEVVLHGLSAEDAQDVQTAEQIAFYRQQAKSIKEIQQIRQTVDGILTREFPDDDKYEDAKAKYDKIRDALQPAQYNVQADGATDMQTEEKYPVEVIETAGNNVSGFTQRDEIQALTELHKTSRGQLETYSRYLDDYETVAKRQTIQGSAEYVSQLKRQCHDIWEQQDTRRKEQTTSEPEIDPTKKKKSPKESWNT